MLRKLNFNQIFVIVLAFLLIGVVFVLSIYAQGGRKGYWKERRLSRQQGEQIQSHPLGYYSHIDVPQLTESERRQLAIKARADWTKYRQQANQRAKKFSDRLENYIQSWLQGKSDAKLPKGLLPPYIDSPKTHSWTLVKPENVDPNRQWYVIPAHDLDPEFKKLHMHGVDSHVTYAKLVFVAPLGSKLLIEGDFPHARFMDYQILQPFDPDHPTTGWIGEHPEVPIVDVDIEPDPGHINPFRLGANRNAKNRHYHLTFELKAGNAVKLNPNAMKNPEYRAPGNSRIGGPFGFGGPFCDGVLTPSVLWLRIYAPDKQAGPLGGVPLPRALLQLPSGEKFWLQPDASLAIERQLTLVSAPNIPAGEPWQFIGPQLGWFKIFGLMLIRTEERAYRESEPWGNKPQELMKKAVRDQYMLFWNRGQEATPPGNYEASATINPYISYLTRMLRLGRDKVYVITGKLPTTPKTRNGEPTMTGAQARYWSIAQYGEAENDKYGATAVHYGSLMDDEITVNENNEYIIVYSRKEDRPNNAIPANGVTWQDWGPASIHHVTIRWMSVMPEWHLPEFAPDEYNVPWSKGGWSAAEYDESLVGTNEPGVMGPYHPIIHYMTREEFEALGNRPLNPQDIPKWTGIASKKERPSSKKENINVQRKVKELQDALNQLRQAQQAGNKQEVIASARKVRAIWDDLPPEVQQEIEDKFPGITEKINRIRQR